MKIKINIFKCIDCICIAYPVLYEIAATLSESAGRKMSLVLLMLLMISLAKKRKKKRDIISIIIIMLFVMVNALRFGIHYVLHQDFYGLILLLFIFLYYSDKKRISNLESVVLNERVTISVIVAFYFVLAINILFLNGLQTNVDWGVAIPMLYGPYGLPHTLAYSLIVIYAMSSILWHKYIKTSYLIIMGVSSICLIWTGVRSAILVLALMLLCDYLSIKKVSKKLITMLIGCLIFFYLLFFTDVIINNPLVQKSIVAAGKGSGITNSRGDFNSYLWNYFTHDTTFMEKMFGVSIEGLRRYMRLRYGTEIHAHNDFMNILVGMGILGIVIFIKDFLNFCKIKGEKKKSVLLFIILFLLSLFNGLYMYIGFVPCIPIIHVYVRWLATEEKVCMKSSLL